MELKNTDRQIRARTKVLPHLTPSEIQCSLKVVMVRVYNGNSRGGYRSLNFCGVSIRTHRISRAAL